MGELEYLARLKELNSLHEKAVWDLAVEYAMSNNTFKVGDVVEDHIGKILIEKIRVKNLSFKVTPCCVYFGVELKKDGTPKKIPSKRDVYQANVERNAIKKATE